MKAVLFVAGLFALFGAAGTKIWLESVEYFQLASILIVGAVIADEIGKLRSDLKKRGGQERTPESPPIRSTPSTSRWRGLWRDIIGQH